VWWNRKHEEKATASNAGPALSAALLYGHTGDASTLAWAERVYGFWNGSMTDAASGAVTDHYKTENGSCTEVGWSFTYNEGLMLGAATALANATSAPAYSRDAARFAGHLVLVQTRDRILFDGCEGQCTCCDCQSFKGIAVRELARWVGAEGYGGLVPPQVSFIQPIFKYSK
jgi:predicted alpha-1,6-mannanase (GH76 family)